MRFTYCWIIVLYICFSAVSCQHHRKSTVREKLDSIGRRIDRSDDSTSLVLLKALSPAKEWTEADQAFYALLFTWESIHQSQSPQSDSLINKALDYYREHDLHSEWMARALYLAGWVQYYTFERVEAATHYYLEALDIADNLHLYRLCGQCCSDLGNIFYWQNLYTKAASYYQFSLSYFQQAKDTTLQGVVLTNIARYHEQENRHDSALVYYNKALYFVKQKKRVKTYRAILQEVGIVYRYQGRHEEALCMMREALTYYEEGDSKRNAVYMSMLHVFCEQGASDSVYFYAGRLLPVSKPLMKRDVYDLLIQVSKREGNTEKVLAYYDLYRFYADSMLAVSQARVVTEAEQKHIERKLQNETQNVRQEKDIQQSRFLFVLLLAFCLLLVGWIVHKNYKRKKELQLHSIQEQICENERLIRNYKDQLDAVCVESPKDAEIQWLHERQNTLLQYLMEQFDVYKKLKLSSGNYNMQEADWLDLTQMMDMLFDNFATRLRETYPAMTQDAVHFCCLVRLRLPLKDLKFILHVDSDAIYKRRYRLKKDLLPADDKRSLDDFLAVF